MRAPWLVLILTEILDLVLGDAVCQRNDTDLSDTGQRSGDTLHRRRRLAFPTGSAFVLTISTLQAIQLQLPSNWNLDIEFDLIWPIPNQENLRKKYIGKRPSKLKRRHRRELYSNFELALDSRNLPGRQCVLRTICESKLLLSPAGVSFIEDAIRLILRNLEDQDESDYYDTAYGLQGDCAVAYPCPFSLLQLILYYLYSNT